MNTLINKQLLILILRLEGYVFLILCKKHPDKTIFNSYVFIVKNHCPLHRITIFLKIIIINTNKT